MSPESSAIPRNSAGCTFSPPRDQRTSASTLATRDVDSSTTGWYSMPRLPSSIAARRSAASSRRRITSACMCAANTSTRPPPASLARDMARSALRSRWSATIRIGERDADARGDRHVPARHLERLGCDRHRQPLGDVDDLLRAGGALDQDGELVAAPAGDGVVDRNQAAQPTASLRQHKVPGAVPDRVVDGGEAVEVDEDRPDPLRARSARRAACRDRARAGPWPVPPGMSGWAGRSARRGRSGA